MLQLRDITKNYVVGDQTIHALGGVSVDFRKSEFVSILGPSGCGKTTLMNIVGGLDRSTGGDLIVNGKSTKDFRDSEWDNYRNKKIGFVFQSYNLIPHLSVLGNVELALTISGISKSERRQRAVEALREVGLEGRMKQKPNQLSGGQMQRVAIARALVNRPEILLADEPTGALDTETSEQIMQLIQKIAADRLVVMVTHNPELAERYSTRIIKMLDGVITEDSHPYTAAGDIAFTQHLEKEKAASSLSAGKKKEKSAMSFFTALSLSGRNLLTKKGRTILSAVAGSIGIIGIALILALSSGMSNYVAQLQSDMLSSTPITISSSTFDVTQAMNALGSQSQLADFPDAQKVYVEKAQDASAIMHDNNITKEYIDYVKDSLDASWYNDIQYKTGQDIYFYGKKVGEDNYSKLTEKKESSTGGMMDMMGGSTSSSQLLLDSEFVLSQYDVLVGTYPTAKDELALVVDEKNQVSEEFLVEMGFMSVGSDVAEYNFADFMGKEFKIVPSDLMYENKTTYFTEYSPLVIDYDKAQSVKITAIFRINKEAVSGALSTGIGYTQALYDWLQEENGKSDIVEFMRQNPMTDPLKGTAYTDTLVSSKEELREADYRAYGGESLPNEISIYPTSYETKDLIKAKLDEYNKGKDSADMITYSDMSELLGSSITSIVDIITIVLIAFTAISLVVSCIMIAIITYISVLERTKEIGILRSVGARKKDVTRVFNAETIIIGLAAGLLGVAVTYLLSIPINLIISAILGISGIASLSPISAGILVLISVGLTLISGLIPARKAAKLDPVTALRTE